MDAQDFCSGNLRIFVTCWLSVLFSSGPIREPVNSDQPTATLYPIYHLAHLVGPTAEELYLLLPAVTEELFVLSLLSRGQNIDSKDKDPQLQKWFSLIILNTEVRELGGRQVESRVKHRSGCRLPSHNTGSWLYWQFLPRKHGQRAHWQAKANKKNLMSED